VGNELWQQRCLNRVAVGTATGWPDVIVPAILASLPKSAIKILRQGRQRVAASNVQAKAL
jgi:hypothetical protein